MERVPLVALAEIVACGRRHPAGSRVEVPEAQARLLVELRAARPAEAAGEEQPPDGPIERRRCPT